MSTNYQVKIDATVSKALDVAQKKINAIKDKVDDINQKVIKPKIDKGGKMLDDLKGKFGDIQEHISGTVKNIPMVGEGLANIASKAGPIGLVVGAIAGIGIHAFNTAKELQPMIHAFQSMGESGKSLDVVVAKAQSMKKIFGVSEDEISKASKTLQTEFGITGVQAMDKLQQALTATNGKLELGDLREFSTQIKGIGGDVDQLLSVSIASNQNGFMGPKAMDTLKEWGIRIREGSDATKELLNSSGVDGAKILKDIQSGAITQEQAFQQVFKNIDKMSVQKRQQLVSGMLGGAGEDLGQAGIKTLATLDKNLQSYVDKAGEGAKQNQERMRLEEQLAQQQLKTSKMLLPIMDKFETFKIKLQILFEKVVYPIVKRVMDVLSNIVGWISSFYTGIERLVGLLGVLFEKIFGEGSLGKVKEFFDTIFKFVSAKVEQYSDLMQSLFDLIRAGVELDPAKIKKMYDQVKAQTKKLFSSDITVKSEDGAEPKSSQPTLNDFANEDLTNKKLDSQIAGNVDNAVSGATSTVKNITINLEALQKNGSLVIQKMLDADEILEYMNHGFTQVLNDANAS